MFSFQISGEAQILIGGTGPPRPPLVTDLYISNEQLKQ